MKKTKTAKQLTTAHLENQGPMNTTPLPANTYQGIIFPFIKSTVTIMRNQWRKSLELKNLLITQKKRKEKKGHG